MATRSPAAYLWATITDLFDGDDLNREKLYKEAVHRLQDYGAAVLNTVHALRSQLSSTESGTPAIIRGSVVMGTLAYYDPIDTPAGTLDGLTLILTTDLAGPVTITFSQPISPAQAATEINTQGSSLGLIATVDDGVDPVTGAIVPANVGKLRLVRPGGSSASLAVGSGTANGALGLSPTGTVGTGSANDGASKIGLGAFTGWAGGTLRAFCEGVIAGLTSVTTDLAGKVNDTGDTMTGHLTMSATSEIKLADRTVTRPMRGAWNISYDATPQWLIFLSGNPYQQLAIGQQQIVRDIDALSDDVINGVSVSLAFSGTHASYPPANFPRLQLLSIDEDGVESIVATATDAPANEAAYMARHTLSITGQNVTVERDRAYRIRLRGEFGGNAEIGLQIYESYQTVTTKGLPPGG
jgi:hypothetical protein